MVTDYFGIDNAQASDLIAWSTLMFWYLFIDLAGDPGLGRKVLDAAAACRSAIDAPGGTPFPQHFSVEWG
jgi:hypothetical protein